MKFNEELLLINILLWHVINGHLKIIDVQLKHSKQFTNVGMHHGSAPWVVKTNLKTC